MNNKDLPAYPSSYDTYSHDSDLAGITKRELFAMKAMQSILVNAERNSFSFKKPEAIKKAAYEMADLMLED